MFNCKPVFVPTYFEDNFVPDWDQLEKLITKRTKMLVVISPGNPTGAVYGEDTMKMFLRICEKHGLWLLHDEAYRDIVFHGHQQASMTGLSDNAIAVRTLSKSHAMTGIRVGWVLSSNEKLIDNVRKSIAYNIMCANTPGHTARWPLLSMEWSGYITVLLSTNVEWKTPQKDYVKWVCRYIGQWVRSIYSPNTRLRETLRKNWRNQEWL